MVKKSNTKTKSRSIMLFAFTPPTPTEDGFKRYADCGFDMAIIDPIAPFGSEEYLKLFEYCDKNGIKAMPMCVDWDENHNGGPCEFPRMFDKTDYTKFSSFFGAYMADEPILSTWDDLLAKMQRFERIYPGKIPYVNLSGCYTDRSLYDTYPLDSEGYGHVCARACVDIFCEKVLDKLKGEKVLSFDYYPLLLSDNGKENVLIHDWLWPYDYYSVKCRDNGYTFWAFIQTTGMSNSEYTYSRELTSARDYRFQCMVALSYGVTGIGSFCYQSFFKPLKAIEMDGEPTETYYYVKKVNKELHKFSDVYLQYKWRHAGLTVGKKMNEYTRTTLKRMVNNITEHTGIMLNSTVNDLLIGEFKKDGGEGLAYMFVNYVEPSHVERNAITVKFKENVKSVNIWRRGVKTVRNIKNDELTFVLTTGDGVFMEINK